MALLMEHFAHWSKMPVPRLSCVPGIQPSAGHTVVGQCYLWNEHTREDAT